MPVVTEPSTFVIHPDGNDNSVYPVSRSQPESWHGQVSGISASGAGRISSIRYLRCVSRDSRQAPPTSARSRQGCAKATDTLAVKRPTARCHTARSCPWGDLRPAAGHLRARGAGVAWLPLPIPPLLQPVGSPSVRQGDELSDNARNEQVLGSIPCGGSTPDQRGQRGRGCCGVVRGRGHGACATGNQRCR